MFLEKMYGVSRMDIFGLQYTPVKFSVGIENVGYKNPTLQLSPECLPGPQTWQVRHSRRVSPSKADNDHVRRYNYLL